MKNSLFRSYSIDHIEQYVPMAKPLAFWHVHGLGFRQAAYKGKETGFPGLASYLLVSGEIRLVLTCVYPTIGHIVNDEVNGFVQKNGSGVSKISINTPSVKESFALALDNGGVPLAFPFLMEDEYGYVELAAVRLYSDSQIIFLNRDNYTGFFLPGYQKVTSGTGDQPQLLESVDHIASELRINEMGFWTNCLARIIGTDLVQQIKGTQDNRTGMIMNICQSSSKAITMVLAEPAIGGKKSKIQENIDSFGAGIHHLAFSTKDIFTTVESLHRREVEMVPFPRSYYRLLRENKDLGGIDINRLEELGILVDKEESGYLFQKFIKPYGDRSYFIYEIVQRVNGYQGFALNNINVLKKAEEADL